MTTYDSIVVGAGPAGSTAARVLAERGARVLLLDRARFPRDKPCGGGVTFAAASEAGVDLSPVIERTVTEASMSFRLGPAFTRSSAEPLAYMTQRCLLDAFLAERAASAGADFRDGVAVRGVELSDEGVTVRMNGGGDSYRGRTLVAADGANGVVARSLGLATASESMIALEGNVPVSGELAERWKDTVALDLGDPPGGYGWLFPKGDHVNVGVGGWRRVGPTLRSRLSALCRFYGLDESLLSGLRGQHLPLRDAGSPIQSGPVLLTGDAAGLINPLTYEGIRAAFVSGRLAAQAIVPYLAGESADLSAYEREMRQELVPELAVSRKIQAIYHRFPRPCVALMRRSGYVWNSLCDIVRGETAYADALPRFGPLRLGLEMAARLSGVRTKTAPGT